jgi:hypothetical protein
MTIGPDGKPRVREFGMLDQQLANLLVGLVEIAQDPRLQVKANL